MGLGFEHQGVIPHVEQPADQIVALEPHETHLVAGGVRGEGSGEGSGERCHHVVEAVAGRGQA